MTGPGRTGTTLTRTGIALGSMVDPRAQAALLPPDPGVYRFRDAHGRALYVGRAVDLRRRVASYWTSAPEGRGLGRMVARIAGVEAFPCDSAHEAAWLERNLLERRRPWWNRIAGGLETPVRIAVIPDPRRPGVRLVHAHEAPPGSLVHGPYLGGERVREAISGLARVIPLAYTGTGLTGSERVMAARRKVGPADRERFLDQVTGVLRRDHAMTAEVLARLDAHRDAAVARLDFEMAAILRDEAIAVGWLTAPQRVAGAEPADAEVAGWCDGWLVRGTIAAGRLDGWLVGPATQRTAARALAVTPDTWRPFLDRAAVLAARLAVASTRER